MLISAQRVMGLTAAVVHSPSCESTSLSLGLCLLFALTGELLTESLMLKAYTKQTLRIREDMFKNYMKFYFANIAKEV